MILLILILIASLVGLLASAEAVVRGSVAMALKFHVPPLLIGLTIVAFGTSAPELLISAQAALNGMPGLALGNVVGSNIANVLLVLGIPALIYPVRSGQHMLRRNLTIMLGASLLFAWFCLQGMLVFWHGAVMFGLIVLFLLVNARRAIMSDGSDPTLAELMDLEEVGTLPKSNGALVLYMIVGLVGLPLASHFLIESSAELARIIGIPDAIIGLSIVALGTSLPELATTVSAAMHKQSAMALGNIIGSNLFNILAVMGVTAMITEIPVPAVIIDVNLWLMLATSFLLVPFIFLKKDITRIWGGLFTAGYLAIIYWNFASTL